MARGSGTRFVRGKAGYPGRGLHDTFYFGNFRNDPPGGFRCHFPRQEQEGLFREKRGPVHGKPRLDERRTDGNERIVPEKIALFPHNHVHMREYPVDEPFFAGAGFGIVQYHERDTLVEDLHPARRAGKKPRGECCKYLMRRAYAVTATHGTIHGGCYRFPIIDTLLNILCRIFHEGRGAGPDK